MFIYLNLQKIGMQTVNELNFFLVNEDNVFGYVKFAPASKKFDASIKNIWCQHQKTLVPALIGKIRFGASTKNICCWHQPFFFGLVLALKKLDAGTNEIYWNYHVFVAK